MTRLQRLYDEQGQSPWLDNLTRAYVRDGTLARYVDAGVRGVTTNPTILARAIEGSDAYDATIADLAAAGASSSDAYWSLVTEDVGDALAVLRPTFDASGGHDGFVSIEVSPDAAHDTARTVADARHLHERLDQPNLLVKIPATAEGIPALRALTSEGLSINVTLIFSLSRYREVVNAFQAGIAAYAAAGGDVARVHSVASFFVSRVDSEVDRRLVAEGSNDARSLLGRSALAQAAMAYEIFAERFESEPWSQLAARGATVQRPLWASTSTKNPDYPDTMYVDGLIGPWTVNTLPEPTITAFEDHGVVARTIDADVAAAHEVLARLAHVGVDMASVSAELERAGVASFWDSLQHVLHTLDSKLRSTDAS